MKRRDFLKILGVAPAIAAAPVLAKTDKPDLYDSPLTNERYRAIVDSVSINPVPPWKALDFPVADQHSEMPEDWIDALWNEYGAID